jgi:hypothetical protein
MFDRRMELAKFMEEKGIEVDVRFGQVDVHLNLDFKPDQTESIHSK